jgi:hypothetical protein
VNRWIAPLALLAVSTPFASAQSIVFQEGFESGFAQWTATGFWNHELATDSCGVQAAPFPEGAGAAWFGHASGCNFEDLTFGGPSGTLTSNTWVTLPSGAGSVSLYFKSWVDSEYCWGGWDVHEVVVTAVGGPNTGFTQHLCTSDGPIAALLSWHERRIDLTAYSGAQVRIAFGFFANDAGINDGLGWLIDDVRIVVEPGVTFCPSANPNNTCPCDPAFGVGGGCFNALKKSATLFSSGVASVAADSLAFSAAEMPPGTAATLFQGSSSSAPLPLGDGLFCVTGSLTRLGTRFAPTGTTGWPVPNTDSLSVSGFVSPAGGDYFYQAIYRDAVPTHCTSATFNLTSAQRVTWTP